MSCCHLVPPSFASVHQLTQSLAGQGKHSPACWKICQIWRQETIHIIPGQYSRIFSESADRKFPTTLLFIPDGGTSSGEKRSSSAGLHHCVGFKGMFMAFFSMWKLAFLFPRKRSKETKRVFGGRLGANQRYRCCPQSLESSHLHHTNCTTHFTSYECVCVVIFYALHCTK